MTNMAALGAYVGGKGIVSLDSVVLALRRMIPEHRKELLGGQRRGAAQGRGIREQPIINKLGRRVSQIPPHPPLSPVAGERARVRGLISILKIRVICVQE